ALGVLGLDALAEKPPSRRFALLAAAPAALLGLGSLARALSPPAVLGETVRGLPAAAAGPLPARFVPVSPWGTALRAVAVLRWLALALRPPSPRAAWMLGVFGLAELVLSAAAVFPLSDPALYYPRLPALEALARAPAGRICGISCLPPNLNQTHGLADVRGFDGADP